MGCIGECIRESLIRDRIVLGIQNPQTRKRLLQERKLTLKKCIDICRSSETSASQMKIISGTKTSEDVNRVKENREPSRPQNGKNDKNDKSRKSASFVEELTRLTKENAQRGATSAVNVVGEITLHPNARNLESA